MQMEAYREKFRRQQYEKQIAKAKDCLVED